MNGEGVASSILAGIVKANIDRKQNKQESKEKNSSNQHHQNTVQETTPLLKEQINSINNVPIETNVESNCCLPCTIL